MKKKVICVLNDAQHFEDKLNEIEGKFTQTSVSMSGTDIVFLGVLFYED